MGFISLRAPIQRIIMLGLTAPMLMSCVGIPVPGASQTREHIANERIDSLEIGKTTKTEVLNLLEHPEGTFVDRTRWIYHIGSTERDSARFCYIMAYGWTMDGKTEGCDPIGENTIEITYLELTFKDQTLASKKVGKSKIGNAGKGVYWDHAGRMWLQHENGERERPLPWIELEAKALTLPNSPHDYYEASKPSELRTVPPKPAVQRDPCEGFEAVTDQHGNVVCVPRSSVQTDSEPDNPGE